MSKKDQELKMIKDGIFHIFNLYSELVDEMFNVMENYKYSLPACIYYKYTDKWRQLGEYSSTFFINQEALDMFNNLEYLFPDMAVYRDTVNTKMFIAKMRFTLYRISACKIFCEECVLRSFTSEQCQIINTKE